MDKNWILKCYFVQLKDDNLPPSVFEPGHTSGLHFLKIKVVFIIWMFSFTSLIFAVLVKKIRARPIRMAKLKNRPRQKPRICRLLIGCDGFQNWYLRLCFCSIWCWVWSWSFWKLWSSRFWGWFSRIVREVTHVERVLILLFDAAYFFFFVSSLRSEQSNLLP